MFFNRRKMEANKKNNQKNYNFLVNFKIDSFNYDYQFFFKNIIEIERKFTVTAKYNNCVAL